MKKIVCPRCDHFLSFDETRYEEGQSIRFSCEVCGRNFGVRLTKRILAQDIIGYGIRQSQEDLGKIEVLENVFALRQEYPLVMGDNLIGRRSRGTEVNIAILTQDMSMDRKHCYVNVSRNKAGKLVYTVRDFPSLVGTFVNTELLQKNERRIIRNDAFVALGGTTIVVRLPEEAKEEEEEFML